MKHSFFISLIPFAAALFATTAFAFPVNGYRTGALVARNDLIGINNGLTLRDVELELYRRGKGWQTIKKILTYKPTEEEKEHRKAFVKAHKEYKAIGREHAKTAKNELKAAGEEYNVKAEFKGKDNVEHAKKAIQAAQKEWHANKNLQQFRYADVSVNVLKSGRKDVNTRYHNGGFHGVSAHVLYD